MSHPWLPRRDGNQFIHSLSEHGQIDRTRKLLGRFDRDRGSAGQNLRSIRIECCFVRTQASAGEKVSQSCHGHQSAV